MENGKREKTEMFVVYAYVKAYGSEGSFKTDRVFVNSYDSYPQDRQLEKSWELACSVYSNVHYLNVEKQIRFN
jgi:hypothetical protein